MLSRPAVVALLALLLNGASAQALTDRQLDNLEAFTRLLSLVRFFHPSDAGPR